MNKRTKEMTLTALMAALLCIIGPVAIPIPASPVPVSLTVIGIYLSVCLLGMWRGTLALVIYLLLGLVGLPVFSGYTGGVGRLFGPTGGYLIGFLFTALISGWFFDRRWRNTAAALAGMVLGLAAAYDFGTLWLAYEARLGASEALAAGVLPYLLPDAVKIIVTLPAASAMKKALLRAGLITENVHRHTGKKDKKGNA